MERNAEGDVAVSIGDNSKPLLSRHGREAWSAPPPSPLSRGSRFQLAPSSFQAEVSSDESTPIANFILEQGKMGRSSSTHNASKWKNLRSRLMPLAIMKTGLARGNKHSKKLLTLILLNIAYSTAQLLVGLLTGRIGLVSDSFHLTFGCGVLSFSLFAMFMAKREGDDAYTYGYKRLEVLAAFTNTLFLLFLSFSLGVEALHAFIQDESEHKHYLIVSAVTNLFVNLLGVWFFRNFARLQFVYKKAEDMNNHSIFLHVLSDSIRSAGVILASWLLMLGVTNAEILCLGLVAVAIFLLTFPLFKASGGVLLQMAPNGIPTSVLNKCLRQVRVLQDVKEIYQARFWEMVPGFVVGTLVLRVRNGANEQSILKDVHSIYNDIGVQDITVQIEVDQT